MIKSIVKLLSLAALSVAAFSCVSAEDSSESVQHMSFTASALSTKTVLVDGSKVYWEKGDQISVSGADAPFVTDLTQSSPDAVFEGQAAVADKYYAVFPYSAVKSWAEDLALVNLPQVQQARRGSFDPAAGITVSSATDQEKHFQFHHVLGYLKFTISADSGDITSLGISSIAEEALSGSFLVSCQDLEMAPEDAHSSVYIASEDVLAPGDYYIAMLPGTYSEGLTFTFTGPEGVAVKTINQSLTLESGKVNTLGVISNLEWQSQKAYYAEVAESYEDWSGDYLITYSSGSTVKVFNSFSANDKGSSTVDLISHLTSDGIPAEAGDPYKAVIAKVGDYYSINISGLGYIGLESSSNKVHKSSSAPSTATTKYLWNITYKDGGSVWLTNVANTDRRLMWNKDASCFRCYTGGQNELTLYRRTSSGISGGLPLPDPTPDPEPDPTPDPEPEPDPDPTPDPDPETPVTPSGSSGKYGWYELPVINYTQSGSYLIDSNDRNLYYAHHMCAGNEKGPGGKQARNYTVCFSARHHCPVWVAAPRHKMYQSGASRTDAYAKDPSIPADIQYKSTSTGGGCNKGHMLGSAERLSSTATNKQVFYYSNIAPQYTDTFNTGGGGWNTLEDWVDGQVCSDTLYVVIGAYFDKYTDKRGYTDNPATISYGGRNDVSRPTMFYYILMRTRNGSSGKALKDCKASEIKCAAFVRSHKTPKGIKVSAQEMMSVSDLEKITGFTYFPNVPQAPKSTYSASDWGL